MSARSREAGDGAGESADAPEVSPETCGDWRRATVASDATHHVLDGAPLYAARFREVLKFHEPGLAPVLTEEGGTHIDSRGRPVYRHRFRRTFGFYEGRAAVHAADGWHHIHPDGSSVYGARYGWCGNFQGGRCPVRDQAGRYFHVDAGGVAIYADRWRYVGDYRDGIAVVQRTDGHSTHIDGEGGLVHGAWYLDLDVFHKAFARARDEAGWMHVDGGGRPVYRRRFGGVEPFYNGQARVERFDGGLEVIDEAGEMVVELRAARGSDLQMLSADMVGFWRSEAIVAAVEVGLVERLPLAVGSVPVAAERLLAALGELGVVDRDGGQWVVTDRGGILRGDRAPSLAAAARYWGADGRAPWGALRRAVTDPDWRPADPFVAQAGDPGRVAAYHSAIGAYATHDYRGLADVLDAGHRVLLDAGGGTGRLAEAVLRARPEIRVFVLDRPEVVAIAVPADGLEGRLRFVGGDLFDAWPASADAVVLARVLHDWDDEQATAILRRARAALVPGGRLYTVEMVRSEVGFDGALLSLHMLLSTGGKERTAPEFRALLAGAGFALREVRPLASVSQVLVAEGA